MDEKLPPQQNPTTPGGIAGENKEHLSAGGNSYESIQAANQSPNTKGPATLKVPVGFGGKPEPKKASFEEVVQDLHKDKPIQNLRTYESDLADMVKDTHVSKVSIAAHNIQHPRPGQNDQEQGGPSVIGRLTMIVGTSILILGSLAILIFIFIETRPQAQQPAKPILAENNIINVDNVETVSIAANQTTFQAFLNAGRQLNAATASDNSVTQILLELPGTTTPLDPETFLADSGAKGLQNWFIRSLGPGYLVGFYNDNASWKPFMIFQVLSYDNAFAGMLNWENGMGTDLAAFYTQSQPMSSETTPPTTSTTTATTTPSTPVIATTLPSFRDSLIDNKNVRVFGGFDQTPLLYYSFPTQNILVITTSQAALQEIFKRLTSTQFVR